MTTIRARKIGRWKSDMDWLTVMHAKSAGGLGNSSCRTYSYPHVPSVTHGLDGVRTTDSPEAITRYRTDTFKAALLRPLRYKVHRWHENRSSVILWSGADIPCRPRAKVSIDRGRLARCGSSSVWRPIFHRSFTVLVRSPGALLV